MIFCISDEIINSVSNNDNTLPEENLFRQLSSVINSDYNILTVESNLIVKNYSKIRDSTVIGNKLKRIFFKCFTDFSSLFELTKKVVTKIIITISEDKRISSDMKVSLNYLEEHSLLLGNSINLLSEDISDSKFYSQITQHLNRKLAPSIEIKFRHSGAAGKNLSTTLETNVLENADFVLSICDSDMKYPESQLGDTAKFLMLKEKELRDKGILHFECYVLEVHEKENLITPKEYSKFMTENVNFKYFLEIENSIDYYDYLLYFDYKNGITKKNISKDINSDYYKEILTLFPQLRNGKNITTLESKDNVCFNLGRKCLDSFDSKYLNENSTNKIERYRKALTLIIWSWGISLRRQLIL